MTRVGCTRVGHAHVPRVLGLPRRGASAVTLRDAQLAPIRGTLGSCGMLWLGIRKPASIIAALYDNFLFATRSSRSSRPASASARCERPREVPSGRRVLILSTPSECWLVPTGRRRASWKRRSTSPLPLISRSMVSTELPRPFLGSAATGGDSSWAGRRVRRRPAGAVRPSGARGGKRWRRVVEGRIVPAGRLRGEVPMPVGGLVA